MTNKGHADDHTDTTPGFASPGNLPVPRTSVAMAACVRHLLTRSREVVFVDPYFGGLEELFFAVLFAMLTHLTAAPVRVTRIEYHLAQKSLYLDHAEFARRLHRRLSRGLPAGLSIDFLLWEQRPGGEILHDRFVLTDLGGVDFSVGLDEGETGQTTHVSRLSRAAHEKIWRDYAVGTAAFDLCHSCRITGAA